MKNKLLKIFVLLLLAYGSLIGIPMNFREVEELLAAMNQTKEKTLEEHDDSGDPDTTDGRGTLKNLTADDGDRLIFTDKPKTEG